MGKNTSVDIGNELSEFVSQGVQTGRYGSRRFEAPSGPGNKDGRSQTCHQGGAQKWSRTEPFDLDEFMATLNARR